MGHEVLREDAIEDMVKPSLPAVPALPAPPVVTYPDGRMDRKNAARYIGLAVKTLAMHAYRGTGPPFVKRGRVFYYREDLDQWLREGRVTSSAEARLAAKPAKPPVKNKAVKVDKRPDRTGSKGSGKDAKGTVRPTAQARASPNTASVDPQPSPRATWRERLKALHNGVKDT